MTTPGIYRHHKGHTYRVLFVAQDSNNDRAHERAVVYVSLDEPHKGNICVRLEREFHETVLWPDRLVRPRFIYLAA